MIKLADLKIGVVVTRWNDLITNNLLRGSTETFTRMGGNLENLTVIKIPGAFEIPLTCQVLAETGKFQALVALGCVIRGETPHFDYVAGEASKGISQISLKYSVPIGFGILTTENMEQAYDRAGGKAGNKGSEAMSTAIEMAEILSGLKK